MIMSIKYRCKYGRLPIGKRFRRFVTKWIFDLYKHDSVLLSKLDKNWMIRSKIEYEKSDKKFKIEPLVTNDSFVIPEAYSFFEIIEIEELDSFKQGFKSLVSKSISVFERNDKTARLDDLDNSYKTMASGNLAWLNLRNNRDISLGDHLKISYLKGPQSTLIVEYEVTPSMAFLEEFKKLIISETVDVVELRFNSIYNIFKKRSIAKGLQITPYHADFYLHRLAQELNFQLKKLITSKISVGTFAKSKRFLYPCIITYRANKDAYFNKENEYNTVLGINEFDSFKTKNMEVLFNFPISNLTTKSFNSLSLFYLSNDEKIRERSELINYISPLFCTVSYVKLIQENILHQRKLIFTYFRKNKDSLFLKKAIRLKYPITKNWLSISRIKKDFKQHFYKRQLQHLPSLVNSIRGVEIEFRDFLWETFENITNDITVEYQEIKSIFQEISEDNITRSNMKIQKILFWLTIVGAAVTVYGTNTAYFNPWIALFLKRFFHFDIPKL